jgi:hypothetical protein
MGYALKHIKQFAPVVGYRVINSIEKFLEVTAMRTVRKIKILAFVTAVFAVLMLAAPGYSWTGQQNRGSGGNYSHGYQNNHRGHHQYGHGYYNGHRRYGHGAWNGYYRVSRYPRYYAPSVSVGFPFPFFLPGFSFYVGP